jgi:hypothetical protein
VLAFSRTSQSFFPFASPVPLPLLPPSSSVSAIVALILFRHRQLDRSPTGSAVGARIALAHAKGQIKIGEKRTYHSIVSLDSPDDAFVGEALEKVELEGSDKKAVRVKTSGRGFCALRCLSSFSPFCTAHTSGGISSESALTPYLTIDTGASVLTVEKNDSLSFAGFKVALPPV